MSDWITKQVEDVQEQVYSDATSCDCLMEWPYESFIELSSIQLQGSQPEMSSFNTNDGVRLKHLFPKLRIGCSSLSRGERGRFRFVAKCTC